MMVMILLYAMFFLKIILSYADLVKDFSPPHEIKYFTIVLFLNLSYSCKVIIYKGLYISTSALAIRKEHIDSELNRERRGW